MIGRILLGILLVAGLLLAYGLIFRYNETLRLLINSPLSILATKKDQAEPKAVWEAILKHQNPPSARDDFDKEGFNLIWEAINYNGRGTVTHPGGPIHAAKAELRDGQLVLSVLHDPDFETEGKKWQAGQAASENYNNAFLTGFRGYSPTPTEDIVVETEFAVSPLFHGSTGIWIEEQGTFDPKTGIMIKPFRSVGFSFLGSESETFLSGAELEATVGFVPVCAKQITDVDVTQTNVYRLVWSLAGKAKMKTDLFINGRLTESCTFPSFYPGEIQLWADNYLVQGFNIDHLNVPEGQVDENKYNYLSVTVVKK